MDCKSFQELIYDFIYDKIEYSEDLEEFLEHAGTCESCNEELVLYYTIHRGLGDVPAPEFTNEEGNDCEQELKDIISFYDEIFYKQKIMKKAGKISIAVFSVMVVCTIVYVAMRILGYL